MELWEQILQYAAEKYETTAEHPWIRYPTYTVLRHGDNRKWYGVLMVVPANKLGLPGEEGLPILNVKCDPLLMGGLLMEPGILPAYHMNKAGWLSVLLDGRVEEGQVLSLLDLSFDLTASRKGKKTGKRITNWLVPANPKYYDLDKAIQDSPDGTFTWKQSSNIQVGDTVYFYFAVPYSAILYQARAIEVDLPRLNQKAGSRARTMRLQAVQKLDPPIDRDKLLSYGVKTVRGPRSMPPALLEEIELLYPLRK